MSVTLLLVPPRASTLGTRLPAHPTQTEGGVAESAAAAEDAVWRGETSPSVCLGFQEDLSGGGGSTQACLFMSAAQVAIREGGWRFQEGCPHFASFLWISSQVPHWLSRSFLHMPRKVAG